MHYELQYGCIGEHLPHSFSREIHNEIGSYAYDLKELTPEELPAFMTARGFRGINVTIPYKQAVIPFLDEIDETARAIGAVNTVVNRDGRLSGYNTDLYGITRLILAMRELGIAEPQARRPVLYIAALGEAAQVKAMAIVERLRREGKYAECDIVGRSLKAQMKYANKIGARYTLILGDSEIESGKAPLRNMEDSSQTEVEIDSFEI